MAVCIVLFLVLSQVLILKLPESITALFRPALVAVLLIEMMHRGAIISSTRIITFIAAIWMGLVVLLNEIDIKALQYAAGVIFYMLMFWAVTGIAWNKRELRCIISTCFVACAVCAAALLYSNPITDFSAATSGHLNLLGASVNRNKNAYVFAVGTVLGIVYLFKGKNIPKLLVVALTAIIGYALLYSQCRGAFFCTVAAVTVFVAEDLLKLRRINPGRAFFLAIAFVAFCVLAYFLLKNSQLSRLVDGDSKSGRDEGIKYAWNLYLGTDWFGKIFGSGFMYESQNTEGVGAHLVYVGFILSSGVIGVTLIALMFITTFKNIKGSIPYAFFTIAFLKTFFEGMEYNLYSALIIATITYNYTRTYGGNINELFSRR